MAMQFSGVDLVILVIMAISVMTGLFRGFIKELFALSLWICAFWGAGHYAPQFAHLFKPWIHQAELQLFATFIVIVIAVLILGGLLSSLLSFLISKSGLTGTDRILGMVFGFVRAVLIIALLILVAKLSGFPEAKYSEGSRLYREFNPVVQWMYSYIPGWLDKIKQFDEASHQAKSKKKDSAKTIKPSLSLLKL